MPNSLIERHRVSKRMSQAAAYGDVVYLAGQVVDDSTLGVAEQTRQVLVKIDDLLAEAGTDKSRALAATIWLADIATFDEMNSAWEAWVTPGGPPVRACVESKLASPGCKVEIALIAAR